MSTRKLNPCRILSCSCCRSGGIVSFRPYTSLAFIAEEELGRIQYLLKELDSTRLNLEAYIPFNFALLKSYTLTNRGYFITVFIFVCLYKAPALKLLKL